MLLPVEHIEPLGNSVSVIVSDEHHFTTDTVLLADFAMPRPGSLCADLGSGCGTIALLWARTVPSLHTDAVELQSTAADMLRRSVELNGLMDSINPVCADLRELSGVLSPSQYDTVVCNPPYKVSGGGIVSASEQKKLARHEQTCTLSDVISAAARLLRFSGSFCMCQRTERLTDTFSLMREYAIEPKRLRLVQGKSDKPPKLFMIEGKRGANPGGLKVLPTLIIENPDGTFTPEMNDIYGCYKDGASGAHKEK